MSQILYVNTASVEILYATGSLVGTSSWSQNAESVKSASWASSSFSATSASFASRSLVAHSSSWASSSFSATSASWASASTTAFTSTSSSFATTALSVTSASWASASTSASYLFGPHTGSTFGTASWAEKFASLGMVLKSGILSGSEFDTDGSATTTSITFATPFPNNFYAITVTGEDARTWLIESKSVAGFDICSNSKYKPFGMIFWQAMKIGEYTI